MTAQLQRDGLDEQLRLAADFVGERASQVSKRSPLHGPRHWRDVARVGLELHRRTIDRWDPAELFMFALLHDSQRAGENHDPQHGLRAARLLAVMDERELIPRGVGRERLGATLAEHDTGKTSRDATQGACWDADRLLLVRVGIRPSPRYLSRSATRAKLDYWMHVAGAVLRGADTSWPSLAALYAEIEGSKRTSGDHFRPRGRT